MISLSWSFMAPSAYAAAPHGYVPGRFILQLSSSARLGSVRQSLSSGISLSPLFPAPIKASLSSSSDWSKYVILQTLDSTATVADIRDLVGASNIETVEQDQYIDFYDYPSDSLFPNQWYLVNDGQQYLGIDRIGGAFNDQLVYKSGTPNADIKLRQLYQAPPPDTTPVVVGVVDTGTDPLHPELNGRIWHNPNEIGGNGLDDDHNGFVDDTIGYDMSGDTSSFFNIQGDNDITDSYGHGTHIAGIVAANADGKGIVGVAPWAQIMTVKIYPNGYLSIGTAGVLYAINNGAQVINISWGIPFETVILKNALRFARENNIFVAIAAGNTGDNTRANPAAIDSTFAVGAGTSTGYMASFSTWGPFVDLVAPGVDILSLRARGTDMYADGNEPNVHIVGPDSLYYLADGTSMAAPVVAGAAALILSFKPHLSLEALQQALWAGADDMVDPRAQNDTLIGPDTVCGYGYLNVYHSLELATNGGLILTSPLRQQRYTGPVSIKAAAIGEYTGPWTLTYSVGFMSTNWLLLASGSDIASDSTIYLFNKPVLNDWVNLRLTDSNGNSVITRFVYVNSNGLKLANPKPTDTLRYSVSINGSVYGLDYDSVQVLYQAVQNTPLLLFSSTREFFDTVVTVWNASGAPSGMYTFYLKGYYESGVVVDSVTSFIASSFAAGWPQTLPTMGPQTVAAADLDHDGLKEVIAGSAYGLFVYHSDGQLAQGFPVATSKDMRCTPAIYDVDGDGDDEIIVTGEDGVYVFNSDGTSVPGWPRYVSMGNATAFGFPNPTVAPLSKNGPPVIMFINDFGMLYAYKLNGDPVFYSLGGYYSGFNPLAVPAYYYAGNSVSCADLVGDSSIEVMASYSGLYPKSGVAVFESRTGRPAFGAPGPHVISSELIYGMVLADLNGDGLPEIIATGQDSVYGRILYVKTRNADGSGLRDLPGWPHRFPEAFGWIGNYPTVADLDLDGHPEIICTFYEFDIASLYAFHADGTPYKPTSNGAPGVIFTAPVTFGNPVVADITGDQYPEIAIRSGYILPGTGPGQLYVLDHTGALCPNFPIATPANRKTVLSSAFSPLIDDINNDGLVEVILGSDNGDIYIWSFDASSQNGRNVGRLLMDNRNSNIWSGVSLPTDVPSEPGTIPHTWQLSQNYPNPFNPSTTISFDMPTRAHVRIDLYNILGQQVATLADDKLSAGRHVVQVDGSRLASGIYLYRLSTEEFTATRKMVLLK